MPEFLDFYDSYEENVLQLNQLRFNKISALEQLNFSIGKIIRSGVHSRVRPVMMTALMAAAGLLPAAILHGIGSESSRPLARVVTGGIICAMFFSIWIFPIFFAHSYRKFDPRHNEEKDNNDEKNTREI